MGPPSVFPTLVQDRVCTSPFTQCARPTAVGMCVSGVCVSRGAPCPGQGARVSGASGCACPRGMHDQGHVDVPYSCHWSPGLPVWVHPITRSQGSEQSPHRAERSGPHALSRGTAGAARARGRAQGTGQPPCACGAALAPPVHPRAGPCHSADSPPMAPHPPHATAAFGGIAHCRCPWGAGWCRTEPRGVGGTDSGASPAQTVPGQDPISTGSCPWLLPQHRGGGGEEMVPGPWAIPESWMDVGGRRWAGDSKMLPPSNTDPWQLSMAMGPPTGRPHCAGGRPLPRSPEGPAPPFHLWAGTLFWAGDAAESMQGWG